MCLQAIANRFYAELLVDGIIVPVQLGTMDTQFFGDRVIFQDTAIPEGDGSSLAPLEEVKTAASDSPNTSMGELSLSSGPESFDFPTRFPQVTKKLRYTLHLHTKFNIYYQHGQIRDIRTSIIRPRIQYMNTSNESHTDFAPAPRYSDEQFDFIELPGTDTSDALTVKFTFEAKWRKGGGNMHFFWTGNSNAKNAEMWDVPRWEAMWDWDENLRSGLVRSCCAPYP